jgi:signal transduction histidine kinase/putative methionine-R-sulfoxide reductase with GAF domain
MLSQPGIDRLPIGLDIINAVGDVIQSSRGIELILSDILDLVMEIMGADDCSIWLYEGGLMRLKASHGVCVGDFEDVALEIGEGITGRAAAERAPIALRETDEDDRLDRLEFAGSERCKAILSVPITAEDKLVGVLNVQMLEPYDFTETEQKFMLFIAMQLVGAIRNTQLYEEVIKGFREIAIIHQVGQIVNSVRNLDELLSIIARTCAEHLSTRGCILRTLDPATGLLEIKGSYGIPEGMIADSAIRVGAGLAGKCALDRRPVINKDIRNHPGDYEDVLKMGMNSAICVPLMVKDKVIGTLGVFDKKPMLGEKPVPFDEADIGLVSVIGTQVAMAIENALLYAEKDTRIGGLSLLLEISNIMRGAVALEDLLYTILTSVTMEQGLGFNRALLFLTDENREYLIGKMAVGPLHAEDAAKHWSAIETRGRTLNEVVMELGRFNKNAGFEIDRLIKGAIIPIRDEIGVLARTVIHRVSHNVANYVSPQGSKEEALASVGFTTFATVPLLEKQDVVGVMVVDNLVTRDAITGEQVELLQIFANQAASAIETSRLYENVERANKRLVEAQDMLVRTKTLATLGEFSAGIAHELRNPLVSIGGFARRLVKMFEGDLKEARYARIIATEVEGMEKILKQILDFAGGASPERRKVDIILVIEHVLVLLDSAIKDNNITVETDYDESIRYLYVDEVQMRQLFINLIKNAVEAIGEVGGALHIRSFVMDIADGGAGFAIEDTGKGIPAEDLDHVFDPFFTKKNSGVGLGLSMCSRVVETSHNGRIFIDSKVGQGTTVMVWFPPDVFIEPPELSGAPQIKMA